MNNKLRIFLADDHNVIRHGLKLLIDSQPDMEVVGDAADGKSAVELTLASKPDLVVMDVSMPELNGQQATQRLKRALPIMKILALTRHNDTSYLQQLLNAGVDGYVLKQSASDELMRAIRTIAGGGKYIDPALTDKLVDSYTGRAHNRKAEPTSGLSERESEVLRLIALGHTNKEIATRYSLSIKTVEAHKSNAMRKLDLQSRVDIIRYAILRGWLQDL